VSAYYSLRAEINVAKGNNAQALEDLDNAVRLDPFSRMSIGLHGSPSPTHRLPLQSDELIYRRRHANSIIASIHAKMGNFEKARDSQERFLTSPILEDDEITEGRRQLALYKDIAIYERLVNVEGRRELAEALATAYINAAVDVAMLSNKSGAVSLYDRAIRIYERLINEDGRRELADDLAQVYMNKAIALGDLVDEKGAVASYDLAIGIYDRLVATEGRCELAGDLARAIGNRAVELGAMGETERSRRDAETAIKMLREEITRTGRADLQCALDYVTILAGEED